MEGDKRTITTETRVHIACQSEAVGELVRRIAESRGWNLTTTGERAVIVTDHHMDRCGHNVVAVVDPDKPAHARRALRHISAGSLGGALSADRLTHDLPLVVGAASTEIIAFSGVLSAAARQCPSVSARQEHVLHMIAHGLSYAVIARRMCVSLATVKREVSCLFDVFGCATKTQLVAMAMEAGFLQA